MEIRKKQHEELFAKKRIQIIQENLYNIEDLLAQIPGLLKNMCAQNMINEQFVGRLDNFLKRMRNADSKAICRQDVANFLMITIHCIQDLEQRMEDSSDYEFLKVKIRNVLHDALSNDDD